MRAQDRTILITK